MIHLKHCHRSNVIYLLAKALGTMRPDQSDSLLPAKRMPMGLIEYSAKFFTASSTRQVYILSQCIMIFCRLFAHLTTSLGYRQCMCCLELNGASYLQVLCGVMRLCHKQMCRSDKVDLQIQSRFESMLGHFNDNHTALVMNRKSHITIVLYCTVYFMYSILHPLGSGEYSWTVRTYIT